MSEGAVVRRILLCSSELGVTLFRNHRGVHRVAQKDCKSCQRFGVTISAGLHNGAPDTIGWMPIVVTPEMVGQRVALFTGIEVKRESGGVVSEDQRRFLTALERDGAVQGVVRSVADLETVLAPWRGRQP
jgi:hypothetical protein